MKYSITKKEHIHIIKVDNLLLEYENRKIIDEVKDLIEQDFFHYIIDLSEMPYMNSTGFNFLISILTKSRNANGDTVIIHVNEKIADLMVIMKLRNVFTVCNTEEEAVELLSIKQIE